MFDVDRNPSALPSYEATWLWQFYAETTPGAYHVCRICPQATSVTNNDATRYVGTHPHIHWSEAAEHGPAFVILRAAAVEHVLEALWCAERVVRRGEQGAAKRNGKKGAEQASSVLRALEATHLALEVVLRLLAASAAAAMSDHRHALLTAPSLDPIGWNLRKVQPVRFTVKGCVHAPWACL